ncbi:nitrate reductase NapAB chaperone NapD [Clostridium tetanomorphum]|uniref:Uncharacterized protein n=1 Tax=Clostridium tetanomorphum TaxID=1553 RepID=A0A923E8N9_CLOTT|nr:hypothetical protein [Clostridium tetanomorphum]KAJ48884.1 homoserine dehydrogenase [Clostridium tetanomorphum DSM 665]KAJ52974.1 homoserine dehydrogenase [Clostridium tetanomorphum DSM 665]MBC2398503.1 hypothetical protein [Clostridium tetanomorphum]MBP1864914.1 nitrate reductase NapAB chaperone NapD [Clostridium tetanomorphum]NRS83120.1 nitrate reductase NapAB chaperone NapD [Clostridium tetanomorphum]
MYKSKWIIRVKSWDKLKATERVSEVFKNCYFINKNDLNTKEIVVFIQVENEQALNSVIEKLQNFEEIISVKSIMQLKDIL